MKTLRKDLFVKSVITIVVVLFIVRLCWPEAAASSATESETSVADSSDAETPMAENDSLLAEAPTADSTCQMAPAACHAELLALSSTEPSLDFSVRHRIRGVHSYQQSFPDVQDVQYPAARANGVTPVEDRAEAEQRKSELLFVGVNPYYMMDGNMSRSIPYLVPKASHLLQHIGRRFLDSLAVKGIPLHKLIVTSVLRTEDDVRRLRRINGNASEQSCHRFGTTFDISYNRYHTVAPPDDPNRRAVRSDSLKYVLCEVLNDARKEGLCYIKYEVKQGCFHITVR